MKLFRVPISLFLEMILLFPLVLLSISSRWSRRPVDIGLGPEPLINNVYHKKALRTKGYEAQTFVNDVYYITKDFDIRADLLFKWPFGILRAYYLFILAIFRYRCLYIYFSGGPLGFTHILWRIEPFLYKLAKVKTVVMPYGGDVQEMSRSANLLFKHAISRDYPNHRLRRNRIASKIDLWTKYADHVIGGCEWVDYMYHWDTLMLGHFSIDVELWKPLSGGKEAPSAKNRKIRILHAPNHRAIKGSQYFIDAVNDLVEEGLDVELIILEKVPNDELGREMGSVDIVADQLIVGWYAMFAIEAMAMGKPVICFLREDLQELYIASNLVKRYEIPIINCTPLTVKNRIRELVLYRDRLLEIGEHSREYVMRHHSTEVVGEVFDKINLSIGLRPLGR